MNKAQQLLSRAMNALTLEGCDWLAEEIQAYLSTPEPEQDEEPVAFLYDLVAYCDHRPEQDVLAKKLPTGLQEYLKNTRPLFLHPSPQAEQRKPLSEEEIADILNVDPMWLKYELKWTLVDLLGYARTIEFAHGIGGGDE